MSITPERVRELLAKPGAILTGHFVGGTSGKHLTVYVAKDRATRLTSVASELCQGIAGGFAADDIDAVVAPALGGIALSQWTAHHLTQLRPDRPEVLALYAEHEEEVLVSYEKAPFSRMSYGGKYRMISLAVGGKIIIKKPTFILKRGFAEDVKGQRVLLVEDILTTGGSVRRSAQAVIEAGGHLVGIGVLANGGQVTAQTLGVEHLEALMEVDRQVFTEEECADHGPCAQGVPVNTDFGHGKDFLARQKA